MAKAFIQAAMDINITYDEDNAPDKDDLRNKLEETIKKWTEDRDGVLESEIEVYVRGGKK